MRVTSLACIQGAWLPDIKPKNVLDIGAGTGLLTLMAAQRYHAQFDAVEIEGEAFVQLSGNVAQCPWTENIKCHHQDIRDFAKENSRAYDLIISNPPFYQNQLKSENSKINLARHDDSLTLEKLAEIIDRHLDQSGIASVLLPVEETRTFLLLAEALSIYPYNQLIISDNPYKKPKSKVTLLTRSSNNIRQQTLSIKNTHNEYSQEYITLLRPYYLNL